MLSLPSDPPASSRFRQRTLWQGQDPRSRSSEIHPPNDKWSSDYDLYGLGQDLLRAHVPVHEGRVGAKRVADQDVHLNVVVGVPE